MVKEDFVKFENSNNQNLDELRFEVLVSTLSLLIIRQEIKRVCTPTCIIDYSSNSS